jgi:WD40 repeat protein
MMADPDGTPDAAPGPAPRRAEPEGWLLAALIAAAAARAGARGKGAGGDGPEGDDATTAPAASVGDGGVPDAAAAPTPSSPPPTPLAEEYVRLLRRPGAAGADAPQALGRFEVMGVLGKGGFGTVYLARDPRLMRPVALKVPHPEVVLSASAHERFLREGRAAARLDHPAIVPVLDLQEPDLIGTIAYAYCPGPTLAQWLRARAEPVSPRRAAALMATLADAVEHAHGQGVLHRDIKPSNVILTGMANAQDRGVTLARESDPLPKLTDFGLARILDEVAEDTRSGVPFGSPSYMAPEQAAGKLRLIGPPTDVYALGAVLYEVLTGRPPFRGDTPAETIVQVLQDEPVAPRTLRPGLPRDLETIVLTCLQKLPARRYPSAAAMRDDLRAYLDGRPIAARPEWRAAQAVRWLRRRPGLFAAGIVAALAPLVLLAGMLAWNAGLRAVNARLAAANARAKASGELARRRLYDADLREAADALAARQPERAQELLAQLAAQPGWERSREFTWRYVRHAARRPLVLLSEPHERTATVALSADGRRVATGDQDGSVRLRDADGTPRWRVATDLDPVDALAFSPDGSRVAAVGPGASAGAVLLDAGTGALIARLALPEDDPLAVRFAGDAETLWVLAGRPGGPPAQVRLRAAREGPRGAIALREVGRVPGAGELAVSADGRRVVRRGDDAGGPPLVVQDVDTGAVLWEAPASTIAHAALSADGRRVAAVVSRRKGSDLVVWEVDSPGAPPARYPASAEPFVALALSADGALVLGRQRSGRTLVRGDGVSWGIEPAAEDPDRSTGGVSAMDPLGRTVAFSEETILGGPRPLRLFRAATGEPIATFPGSLQRFLEVAFPGDGRALAVRSGHRALFWPIEPAPDPQPSGHAREAWAAAYAPDGRMLVTGSDDVNEPRTLRVWEAATGVPLRAWAGHPGTTAALAMHPTLPLVASVGLCEADNLRLWKVPSGEPVANLPGNAGWLRAVAFSPDSTRLAVGGNEGVVRVYEWPGGRPVRTLEGPTSSIRAVAFAPDGTRLAAGGNDGDVRTWDLATGAVTATAEGDMKVAALAYTPDGATLVAGEEEGGLVLRDAATLRPVRRLDSGCEELRCLALTPDGRTLAAPGAPGTLSLWDCETGQRLATVAVGPAKLQGLRFAPDGTSLAVCDYAGGVRLLRAPRVDDAGSGPRIRP